MGSVVFGHEQMQHAIRAINELVEVAGKAGSVGDMYGLPLQ